MTVHIPGSSRRSENHSKCVKCGSDKVASIAYGLPTDDAFYDAQVFGDVVFGGCIIRGDRNSWHCRDCSHSWSGNEEGTGISGFSLGPFEEREDEGPDPVREYYRDRHARRHGFSAPDLAEFDVDCWGVRHRVVVTGNGQLVFPDHEDGIIPYDDYLVLVVKSRTLNFVRVALSDLNSGRKRIQVNIGLHNSRRWLNRVHNKGWAVLGGHFIFEVREVISKDRMRVLALRKTAPLQLAIEEAIAERDGDWRLSF